MEASIDLSKNIKQSEYFYEVLKAVNGLSINKYFAYGGAIRGGKTYVTLFILIYLCGRYPGSRWHVIRKDLSVLKSTTIPSFQKLIAGSKNWKILNDPGNTRAQHINGSQIFFKSESLAQDPSLNDFLGLETNGIFMEQAEELSIKLWEKSLERSGSWYIDPMPPAFIFLTFNPTQNWVKEKFHMASLDGRLKSPYYYLTALPNDNPFVTQDQWSAWNQMADRYKQQFVLGDWTDFNDGNNRWAFAYESDKHDWEPKESEEVISKNNPLYLSFDFNRNPISCCVIQHINSEVRVIEQIKLANSDIYALCDYIKVYYPNFLYIITGDSTGRNSSALVKDNLNYYMVIKQALNLGSGQMRQPVMNPSIQENQVLVNSILANYKVKIHKDKAKALIYDLKNVKISADNKIEKSSRTDEKQQADALDCFRYWCNTFLKSFLKTAK